MITMLMTTLAAVHYTARDYVFFLLNLGIVAGYLSIAITMLFAGRILPFITVFASKKSRLATAVFFVFASITRVEFAIESVTPGSDGTIYLQNAPTSFYAFLCRVPVTDQALWLHIVQFISVWAMLLLLGHDFITRFKVIRDDE